MDMFDITNEKFKTIKISDEEFKITAILPRERIEIAVKKAYLQGNMSIEAFSLADIQLIDKIATVDVCVLNKPDKLDDYDSCRDWDNEDLIDTLYNRITKLTKRLDKNLKKNKSNKGGT